jgi:hypothetical protein
MSPESDGREGGEGTSNATGSGSPNLEICPFFRSVGPGGVLAAPRLEPHPSNVCGLLAEQVAESARVQAALCLRIGHLRCPRYVEALETHAAPPPVVEAVPAPEPAPEAEPVLEMAAAPEPIVLPEPAPGPEPIAPEPPAIEPAPVEPIEPEPAPELEPAFVVEPAPSVGAEPWVEPPPVFEPLPVASFVTPEAAEAAEAADVEPARVPVIARRSRMPIILSSLILILSLVVSVGYVVGNGGLSLRVATLPSPSTSAGTVASATPDATSTASVVTASPTAESTPAATPSPTATPAPTATPKATTKPTAKPTASPRPSGTPSAGRLAKLTPCSGTPGCYVYVVQSGDTLSGIATYFGVSVASIMAMNPTITDAAHVEAGDSIRIPTPSR